MVKFNVKEKDRNQKLRQECGGVGRGGQDPGAKPVEIILTIVTP
jgi:hypothetical protein